MSFPDLVAVLHRLDLDSPAAEKFVDVALVTNQDNGIASYARGSLLYRQGGTAGGGSLVTPAYGGALSYLFSDRALRVGDPGFGLPGVQPFAVNASDSIGLRLDWLTAGAARLSVILFSWGGGTFTVELSPVENLLYGVGAPVGCNTSHAVYLLSFLGVRLVEGVPTPPNRLTIGGSPGPAEDALKMPSWLQRAAPETLGVFLGKTASSRKSGLFVRHLCRCYPEAFVDPRSLAAIDAADRYEAGEIDELAYQAAVQAGVHAAQEAQIRARGTQDPQTGTWSGPSWAASCAMTAANIAREVATRGYYKQVLGELGQIVGPSNSRYSTPKKRRAQAIRHLFLEHFGDTQQPVAIDPSWRTEAVVGFAAGIYAERAFEHMPILGDALEEAGCADADVLGHCRGDGTHVRGCWLLDALLGKS